MTSKNIPIYDQRANFRLTAAEKERLEAKAQAEGMTLAAWGRTRLLQCSGPSPSERRHLTVTVIACEVSRLTLIAAQESEDIASNESRERIDLEARNAAGAIVERWIGGTV